ncbi:MAG: hypothetical protein ACI4UT_01490 [Candidatus Enteromonas sp.]
MSPRADFLSRFDEAARALSAKDPRGFSSSFLTLPFEEDFPFEEAKNELAEAANVLSRILGIIRRPRIVATKEEVVLRSELSGKLSHESFEETMRDPKLWKEKDGSMAPEYVHSETTVDSLVTYENRFICLLLTFLEDKVAAILKGVSPLIESFHSFYSQKGMPLGPFSPSHDIASHPDRRFLYPVRKDVDRDEVYENARKILRRIRRAKETEFFRLVSPHPLKPPVIPNNVLLHEPSYRYCYRYYATSAGESVPKEEMDRRYFHYVALSLLRYLYTQKLWKPDDSFVIGNDKDRLHPMDVAFRIPPFTYEFSFHEDRSRIETLVSYKIGRRILSESRFALLVRRELSQSQSDLGDPDVSDEHCFISQSPQTDAVSRVLPFTPYRNDGQTLLGELLSAMGTACEISYETFTSRCPVCGKEGMRYDGSDYLCPHCEAKVALLRLEGKDLAWIKNYGR